MNRVLPALFLVTACNSQPAVQTAGTAGELQECGLAPFADTVGLPLDDIAARLPDGTRVLRPGAVVTRDYVPERPNVAATGAGAVERLFCG